MTAPRNTLIRQALENWAELNKLKNSMTEEELLIALRHERRYHKRQSFLFSIHQRFCTVRREREREELLEIVNAHSND